MILAVFGVIPVIGMMPIVHAGERGAIDIPDVNSARVEPTLQFGQPRRAIPTTPIQTTATPTVTPSETAAPTAVNKLDNKLDNDIDVTTQHHRSRSPLKPPPIALVPEDWWSLGSASPIAVALGAAEGTRHTDGGKNPAYYWHTDPGNAANNFGTFSWQHLSPAQMLPVVQASTTADKRAISAQLGLAELADAAAFARIERFQTQLRDQAATKGMSLTLTELINGLDLANQSPLAALSPMGYLDRLEQMQGSLTSPEEQILEARVWSFWHPSYNRWDAPGLGNTYATIRADQARRMAAIAAAMDRYLLNPDKEADHDSVNDPALPPTSSSMPSPPPQTLPTSDPTITTPPPPIALSF